MARTLEIEEEEESRIAELERIAREGDEIEKMIAEVQLAEERERVVGAEELALQAEAVTPKGKPEDVRIKGATKGGARRSRRICRLRRRCSPLARICSLRRSSGRSLAGARKRGCEGWRNRGKTN